MRKYIRIIVAAGILAVLATQFTNCADSADSSLFQQQTASNCFAGGGNADTCFVPIQDNLEIDLSVNEMFVRSEQASISLGGNCNAGNYPDNFIDWELQNSNGVTVMNSNSNQEKICSSTGDLIAGDLNKKQSCIQGRFIQRINLPVQHIGLRVAHPAPETNRFLLRLCIRGLDSKRNIYPQRTSGRSINLLPTITIGTYF